MIPQSILFSGQNHWSHYDLPPQPTYYIQSISKYSWLNLQIPNITTYHISYVLLTILVMKSLLIGLPTLAPYYGFLAQKNTYI